MVWVSAGVRKLLPDDPIDDILLQKARITAVSQCRSPLTGGAAGLAGLMAAKGPQIDTQQQLVATTVNSKWRCSSGGLLKGVQQAAIQNH